MTGSPSTKRDLLEAADGQRLGLLAVRHRQAQHDALAADLGAGRIPSSPSRSHAASVGWHKDTAGLILSLCPEPRPSSGATLDAAELFLSWISSVGVMQNCEGSLSRDKSLF